MKVFSFKADEEDLERWRGNARKERLTLGAWIRNKLNEPDLGVAPTLAIVAKKAQSKVLTCEHRLPPGSYCKRCQVLKK